MMQNSQFKFLAILVLGVALGVGIVKFTQSNTDETLDPLQESIKEQRELSEMIQNNATHADYEKYFQAIAKTKGASYAFDLMKTAPLPFGLDTHLLGHAIGDILYEQERVDGMKYCTHDFRNACSHTIVVGALLEYGTDIKDRIREACEQAPGGTGAYTMCYHGLGHGVLAFNDYDMEKTAEMCRIFGTEEYKNQESSQCFGGAIMEIIGGGGHNRELWEIGRSEQLSAQDPLDVCDKEYLTDGQRDYCYVYITPFLLEAVGADQGNPQPADFTAVFKICNEIDPTEKSIRRECFGGLGKEFIGIVAGRDFRDGIKLDARGFATMQEWCKLAGVEDGIKACQGSVVGSLYWGGENDIALPLGFCAESPAELTQNCYEGLFENVDRYVPDRAYRAHACTLVPEAFTKECSEKLLSNDTTT